MMFVHVSPESSSFQESISSLKFGARVSDITLGQAKRNVETVSTLEAKETNVRSPCVEQMLRILQ
jgi:kinesin family member C2/C3